MKIRNLFYILAAAAMFTAVSCKDEKQPEPAPQPEEATLSVAPTSVDYETTGSSKTLTVKSNADWTVTVSPTSDWLTISPLKGSKDGTVTMTATTNVGLAGAAAEARECVVTVSVEGKKVDVKVSQAAEAIVFVVSGDTAEIPAAGGKVNVSVEYNESYTTETLPEWITPATKATATDALVFDVAANDKQEARQGEIAFKSATGKTGKVTVKQAAAEAPADPHVIKSVEELINFLSVSAPAAAAGETFKLDADIDMTSAAVSPATEFKGVFDGQGHKITWSFKNESTEALKDGKLGIFANVTGTVKDLKVKATVSQSESATFNNCAMGGVSATASEGAVFTNCEAEVDFSFTTKSSATFAGGIVGNASTGVSIENCNAKGVLKTLEETTCADQMGGIAGHMEGKATVKGCTSSVDLIYLGGSNPRFGGMIGYTKNNSDLLVSGCTASGTYTITPSKVKDGYNYAGGVIGYTNTFSGETGSYVIENCVSNVDIVASVDSPALKYQARYAGIIAQMPKGENGIYSGITIKNCQFNGTISNTVTGTSAASNTIQMAGIMSFGESTNVATISGCTMNGKITNKGYAANIGGIFGNTCAKTSSIKDCVVTKAAELSSDTASTMGIVAAAPSAFTEQVTAKVTAFKFVNVDPVELTFDNYKNYAFGKNITDAEGIVWDGDKPAGDPDIPGVGYNDPGLTL